MEDGPLPPLEFDPEQLRQVLIIFENALEAMPRGGEIAISTRVRYNAEIVLADTGEGMAPEVASNIFQPYFTTKAQGTGLGLAICQKHHRGARWLHLRQISCKGTAFTHRTATGAIGLIPTQEGRAGSGKTPVFS